MTTTTPADQLRARITRALDECRTMIPAAQADVVLSVLRKATQPEIKAATLGTTTGQPETAPAVDRAAVLREGADLIEQALIHSVTPAASKRDEVWDQAVRAAATELRDVADGAAAEAQQPTPAPAEAVPAVFADGGVNDIRELYAVHEAITASGGQLTHHVHRAVDALRAVWDRELRREQQRNARRPTP